MAASSVGGMSIEVLPATADRYDDVATMVGPQRKPDASVCWCLSHRVSAKQNRALVGRERGEFVRDLCGQTISPGVLAYDEGEVVGWAAIAPRAETQFSRSTTIPVLDDVPVWSLWCVRVRPGHRGRGLSHDLIRGAVDYARSQGAPMIEAYPVDNEGAKVDLTMAFVGTRANFEKAGFTKASDTTGVAGGIPRVLMRLDLR